jgi:predicted membrane protein
MTSLEEQYQNDNQFQEWEKRHRKGRVIGGIALIVAGVLYWFKRAGVLDFPYWLFSWQMLLIVIGVINGIKHDFKNATWLILISIGGIFLVADFIPGLNIRFYTLPLILIMIGIIFIVKPKNKYHYYQRYKYRKGKWNTDSCAAEMNTTDEYLNVNNVFGGVKKNIITKNFKGGEINNVFAGCEINLMQSDIQNEAVIDINNTFAGLSIIVPNHWQIRTDISTVLGGVDDQRGMMKVNPAIDSKTLVLKGSVICGGIEIKSY